MAFGLWRFCQLRDARDVWRPLPKYNLGWVAAGLLSSV
jgi:hypothetical protein